MLRKKLIKVLVALMFISMSACGSSTYVDEDAQSYYKKTGDIKYIETRENVDPQETLTFDVEADLAKKLDKEDVLPEDVFQVYLDKGLTEELAVRVRYDEDDQTLTLRPAYSADFKEDKYDDINAIASDDWGIYSNYYIVQNINLETGKSLKKRELTILQPERDIETPEVKIAYNEQGEIRLSWDEVSRADEYLIVRLDLTSEGKVEPHVIGTTKKDSYTFKESDALKGYKVSEDEQYAADVAYWWENSDALNYQGVEYGVIARSDEEVSVMGWPKKYEAGDTTCSFAGFAQKEASFTNTYTTIQDLPMQVLASSCEGETLYRMVSLDAKKAKVEKGQLLVPYTIKDSSLSGVFTVTSFDDNYKKAIQDKQKDIKSAYSKEKSHDYTYKLDKTVAANAQRSTSDPKVDDYIFPGSEGETFIAKNMIDGAHIIDYSAYAGELAEYDMYDLIEEIVNQNPMIMEYLRYDVDAVDHKIYVQYLYGTNTRKSKQQQIRDAVKKVTAQIITPGMSDVDKVYTINQYIADNSTYDDNASDIITNTGELGLAYYDSNTAYGILVNKIAVCEGYATAFQLLCHEAGLECISVSGHALPEKEIRHAWNRVNIEGQWYIVDPTFNDTDGEGVENSALLLPDSIGDAFYEQDEYFMLDDAIDKYTAVGDQYEYYRNKGLYVSVAQAPASYSSLLAGGGEVTLRLPETTSDDQYDRIVDQVVDTIQRSIVYTNYRGVLTMRTY